jgi:thiol-disulfide isomerase/thioredoxin
MQRLLIVGLVLFSGNLWIARGDEPKAPTTALGRKVAKLQKTYEGDEKELRKKLANAKDPDEQKQINFLIKELHALTAIDALELAEEGKKDEAGLEAAVFALKLLGQFGITGENMDKAANIVMTHHIDNPKIAPALEHMVQAGRTGELFLEAVVEKALNKEVQALAMYYNALAMDLRAAAAEGPTGDDMKIAAVRGRAADMMEKAAKQAPDAKVGDSTLAKVVAAEVVSLRIGVGNPVPDVEGTDLDGKKVKLSSYRGKVVLLDFWATWCGPCVGMIPHERELVSKMSGKPFTLLSVSVDEEKATLTEFQGKEKMPWAHWWDGAKGPVAKMFRVRAYPTLFLIDAKGMVRKKWLGAPKSEELDKAVEELVAEAQKK